MKIVAILGSPRSKGSGYRIARQIEARLQLKEPTDFEYIALADENLELCRGCFLCVRKGVDLCPLQDYRNALERKIENADGVVLVSPCYVSNVSWLMKNFIDRFCYTNHRPKFFGQKLMLVSNAGAGMEKTLAALRLALGGGPEIAAELAYLSPPWPLDRRVEAKQAGRVRKQTDKLYRAIKRDEARGGLPARPSFSDFLRFKFFKKISADTRDYLTADYEYYRNLEGYYYRTSVSVFKRVAAVAALKVGMVFMRDLAPRVGD